MSCNPVIFFVPVLSGTVEGPIQAIVKESMHPPLQLPLYLLDINDMLKIAFDLGFDENFIYQNKLFRCMISDIGGQVRALEIFYGQISDASETHSWDDIDLLDIMTSLEVELERPVDDDESLESKPSITYKSLKSSGILTLEPLNTKTYDTRFYVRLPYLWIRLLFWALRYCLFSALGYKQIELKELLKGAHYSDDLDVNANVDIPDYKSVSTHCLIHRYPSSKVNYDTTGKICDISSKNNNKIYKNGGGAEGDGFCFLSINEKPMILSLQMKWRKQDSMNPEKFNDSLIKVEYEKSKKVAKKIGFGDNWILLILSIREGSYTKKELPSNCVIVDKGNFNDFYGKIYSSRAQFFAEIKKL
ncbi:hypothetical protein GLOIN_2v1668084 [Rhizophagus clarus]|uniref:Uncharacterized protein n=1 Tax=Rhizophagus clarus TaxID=94130 RepID=A0A8H3LBF2_9GLOM|nr:hypothetical protein GLOIN_2v1668084 [Rhizophagus clarus]